MIVSRFIIKLKTPLHCGGGNSLFLDGPVSRDPFGYWNIQGSSLAGVLRASLREIDKDLADSLFGFIKGDLSKASLVWFSDANLLDFDEKRACDKAGNGENVEIKADSYIRDHVHLQEEGLNRGTSVSGHKFDEEIVPPGAEFAFELKFDEWQYSSDDVQKEKEKFILLCKIIASGQVRLGGKTVNGYGCFETIYAQYLEFDMSSEDGITHWLNLDNDVRFTSSDAKDIEKDATIVPSKEGYSFDISIPLQNNSMFLPGGVSAKEEDVGTDITCLTTPVLNYKNKTKCIDVYTATGSSIRGAIRHRVFEICNTLNIDTALATEIFGCEADESSKQGKAGLVSCDDAYLKNVKSCVMPHVKIDSFTGGNVDGALFFENPLCGNIGGNIEFDLHMEGRKLTLPQLKILAHALLDLCNGELAIGAGCNKGYGFFKLKGLGEDIKETLSRINLHLFKDGTLLDLTRNDIRESLLSELENA